MKYVLTRRENAVCQFCFARKKKCYKCEEEEEEEEGQIAKKQENFLEEAEQEGPMAAAMGPAVVASQPSRITPVAEEQEELLDVAEQEGPMAAAMGPAVVAASQPLRIAPVAEEQEELLDEAEQEGPMVAAMVPAVVAASQPLRIAPVSEEQYEEGETEEARRIIRLSFADYKRVIDTSSFFTKGKSVCGFHPSQWCWQRKGQTKVNPERDKIYSNVRYFSSTSGNIFLLLEFGQEVLRVVLSLADFNLLLKYKCIWYLLDDRWGLEPEVRHSFVGQEAREEVQRAVASGSSSSSSGKPNTAEDGSGIAKRSRSENLPENGEDEATLCRKLVDMKGGSLVANIGGIQTTLVRSQLGHTDLLKKQNHYFIGLELLNGPEILIGVKKYRFTELFRYIVSSVRILKRVESNAKNGPYRLLASFTHLETLEGEETPFILCLLMTTMCSNPRDDCLVFNTITNKCELWTDGVTLKKYNSNLTKPIFSLDKLHVEMIHFLNNSSQFYHRSRLLPLWYENPSAANPPRYTLKQVVEAENKWELQNNRTPGLRLREKCGRLPVSIDISSEGELDEVVAAKLIRGKKRVAIDITSDGESDEVVVAKVIRGKKRVAIDITSDGESDEVVVAKIIPAKKRVASTVLSHQQQQKKNIEGIR